MGDCCDLELVGVISESHGVLQNIAHLETIEVPLMENCIQDDDSVLFNASSLLDPYAHI